MEYKRPSPEALRVKPRLIIHGGAGNIKPSNLAPPEYEGYRRALLMIVAKTNHYMTTPRANTGKSPSALETATHAVTLLEDNPLFNSGHGAVFTRDGINELEASVMVSRGFKKRGVGVTGLRHVRNPILLAKAVLEHGEVDLGGDPESSRPSVSAEGVDVPSAQGHTLLHGETAETLARKYGLEIVGAEYFFTQKRWDEHVRALEREKEGKGVASWSREEFLPQGTPLSGADAVSFVAGPGGELQRSAGNRWRVTGEGEGGIIGIEIAVVRDAEGSVVGVGSEVLQDFNCNGMYRAWIDDDGKAHAKVYREEIEGEDVRDICEKW
ncbi:putative isoaspartyl peptidase/L-asparaginase [Colletotrichum chlorophyti]|uniref:Putative isoaspartyl peptidase/L-asparaginase n=1 Tax=Colletotrichum chlorophyti TaxID=708187 RepID=A0A1Q8RPV9_9PEZI|nr:putative isoaspartyl peptidase/L-asparaginase [Colletotrichum chlorophyti]